MRSPKIEVVNTYQNLGQAVASLSNVSNFSFSPTIEELNRIWGGHGSTVSVDDQKVKQLEPDDALFGTHLREAIRTVRGS